MLENIFHFVEQKKIKRSKNFSNNLDDLKVPFSFDLSSYVILGDKFFVYCNNNAGYIRPNSIIDRTTRRTWTLTPAESGRADYLQSDDRWGPFGAIAVPQIRIMPPPSNAARISNCRLYPRPRHTVNNRGVRSCVALVYFCTCGLMSNLLSSEIVYLWQTPFHSHVQTVLLQRRSFFKEKFC